MSSLRFMASGSYQMDIGLGRYSAMSQPSVSRSLTEVLDAFESSGFIDEYIKFPSNIVELNSIRQRFYDAYGFPGVIGCVDCTHVAIFPPPKNHPIYPEHIYVNRKGYHSINVQLICDDQLKILSVNSKYPGSTHDSFIWNNSNVLPVVQELHTRYPSNYILLGDSGYALRPWMLTPITNAVRNTPEYTYNLCQQQCRSLIEDCNGVLKMRFRCCLKDRVLHYSPIKSSKIINVCCALHNMCISNRLVNVPPEPRDIVNGVNIAATDGLFDADQNELHALRRINPILNEARQLQQRIVRSYFT